MLAERLLEAALDLLQRDAVLGTPRTGEAGLDSSQIESQEIGELRVAHAVFVEEALSAAILLYELDLRGRAAGRCQIAQGFGVDGEEAAGGPVFGRHIADGRTVGKAQRADPRPVELHELTDSAVTAEHLGDGEDQICCRHAFSQGAGHAHADHLRRDERQWLAEHRGLGLDAADAPAEDAKAVDHRRVRVGADERVGKGDSVAVPGGGLHDLRQELQVHLVHDTGAGRNDAEVAERLLGPAQEGVALTVTLVFAGDVDAEGVSHAEGVDLHRMVYYEVDWKERVDALGVGAQTVDFGSQGGEIGDDGYASQVLKEDARRKKGQLTRREGARRPRRQRMNILLGDDMPVEAAEEVLEEHADGEGQTADIGEAKFGKAVEAVVRDGAGGCFERS